jgi:multicomponent Na+:H+ antiporter subunit F
MAGMNSWLVAAIGLLPPFALALWLAWRGRAMDRLVAVALATALAALMMAMLSFAFDQPSIIDLALTLSFLSLPGTLVFAHFFERWI